ncbi:Txe/YoeB family addiction module toxin [Aerococcus loyolae]|uniref:Endoribonuclease YoeB n=1 Tax=Aerococcus loyolae TaxID=2976809 RepID=A0ABT4BXD7_9LACT|nr:Txe/YoeB family addiction module toxin [Aerococcus loyolae]MCY3024928.1 Txe/YoeB family addiction module toxin [Aerococcus loyolae]MCY3027016.1 Txe/YoeB family addiction module toxin [Aerococcus loyolae]MCY3028600.1 Txe/YoeB family addiction module toxin [Aerococcus loyolae]OAM70553.1 toxin YoeB [Aerococcus loyolae]
MKVHWSRRSVIEREDWKVYDKIYRLLRAIKEAPYQELDKPEPLKYDLSDYWSRRITRQVRLVYRVTDNAIEVLFCKYHY